MQALLDSNRLDRTQRVTAEDPSLLVGIAFDESGERLTPTHTRKGVRRYRYYVSRNLHVFRNSDANNGLRVPTQELEGAVIKTIVNYLVDESRLLGDTNLEDTSAVKELIRGARSTARDLEGRSTRECMAILKKLLQRVVVGRDQLQIILTGSAILSGVSDIALTVPTQFHKHGKGIRMVVRAHNKDMGNVDRTLAQLLERSRNWFDRFTKGGDAALKTIADEEGVMPFYVTRLMYLAFLAPDIVQAIHAGSQPPSLTADKLMHLLPLPIRWDDQQPLLGIAPATT